MRKKLALLGIAGAFGFAVLAGGPTAAPKAEIGYGVYKLTESEAAGALVGGATGGAAAYAGGEIGAKIGGFTGGLIGAAVGGLLGAA